MAREDLWASRSPADWHDALDRYEAVVEQQGVAMLVGHDKWFREELPRAIASRDEPHVTLAELVRATEWKMARGVWRAPNLIRVRGIEPGLVVATSTRALATIPQPMTPIAELASLDGVGPATASAVVSAAAPHSYPFFDELVAAQVPSLGAVKWTLAFYGRYADALRERAAQLGAPWTPVMLERALWAHVGGKRGTRTRAPRSSS